MSVANDWVYSEGKDAIVLPSGKPSRTKKVTGTRLAKVLGLNPWGTPFQAWCEITKTAEPKFEGSKFTEAGNAIEPKLVAYVEEELGTSVLTPEAYWGALYSERKYGFFPDVAIFDGMWDGLEIDPKGRPRAIVECKTTQMKNAPYWQDGPPVYYLIQAMLYAKLQGVSKIIFPVAFLEEGDYAHPEQFVVRDGENARFWFYDLDELSVEIDGQLYNIDGILQLATEWYHAHVVTGISPAFDESKDADYLKILRTKNVAADNDLDGVLSKIKSLEDAIAKAELASGVKELEKGLKSAKDALKGMLTAELGDNDEYAEAGEWRLTRDVKWKVDETALKDAGLFEKFAEEVESLRLAKKPKEKSS